MIILHCNMIYSSNEKEKDNMSPLIELFFNWMSLIQHHSENKHVSVVHLIIIQCSQTYLNNHDRNIIAWYDWEHYY